ncbi:MAG: regulatory protein RecX [Candidatus Goldiibacteriota bacterium]
MEKNEEAFLFCLKLIKKRDYSEKEISARLKKKDYDGDTIKDTAARLKAKGYIDDTRVARNVFEKHTVFKPSGAFLIRKKMEERGISEELINEIISGLDEKELLRKAVNNIRKKKVFDRDKLCRKEYWYKRLLSLGFEGELIENNMDIIKEEDN